MTFYSGYFVLLERLDHPGLAQYAKSFEPNQTHP